MDGSAMPFIESLRAAGVVEQEAERKLLPIIEPVRVTEGEAELVAWPGEPDKLEIIYELDYPNTPIGHQIHRFTLTSTAFIDEIAPSRTFVLDREAEQAMRMIRPAHVRLRDQERLQLQPQCREALAEKTRRARQHRLCLRRWHLECHREVDVEIETLQELFPRRPQLLSL